MIPLPCHLMWSCGRLAVASTQPTGRAKRVYALVGLLLAALSIGFYTLGQRPAIEGDVKASQTQPTSVGGGTSAETEFWKTIHKTQPVYKTAEARCLVDGTSFDLPSNPPGSGNRAGGTATDLMPIAIRPDEDSSIKPNFDLQEFEQKMGTCNTCGATYMDIDMFNISSSRIENGVANLQAWDLSSSLPSLDPGEHESWTSDVQSFVRYKVQVQAGFPPNELGFTALAGAYCTNFSTWYGKDYTVPSPAFYALASAQIRLDLEQDLPAGIAERSLSAMLLGELYRLLGRRADASKWFELARNLGGLDKQLLVVLGASERFLEQGDFSLKRVPDLEGKEPPPIGWQIDNMLPNISGHITQHRKDWAGLDDPAEIEAKIISVIAKGAGF